jgi:hypothetical protein
MKRSGGTPAAKILWTIDGEFRRAWLIAERTPMSGHYLQLKVNGSGALAAKWLETLVNKNTDYADPKTRVRPARPSHADVTFMDRMFDLPLLLDNVWMRKLIWYRAARIPWGDIRELDEEHRGIRQQQRLYDAALAQLVGPWLEKVHKN